MARARMQPIVTSLGLIVAVLAGVLAYRWAGAANTGPDTAPELVQDWREYAISDRVLTGEAGDLTVTVFTDYQCPFCQTLDEQLSIVDARYPGRLRVVLRHFPLERAHPFARAAAHAVECGNDFGRRRQVHAVLFAHQDSIGRLSWNELGRRADVADTVAFTRCIESEIHSDEIEEDVAAARRLGATGTPVLLLEEYLIRAVEPIEVLEGRVRSLLARSSR